MSRFSVYYYQSGKSNPVEFIGKLSKSDQTKIERILIKFKQHGFFIGRNKIKKVSNSIFELRIKGKREIRLLFTFHQHSFVILHCFIKKTQKLPPRELSIAKYRLSTL